MLLDERLVGACTTRFALKDACRSRRSGWWHLVVSFGVHAFDLGPASITKDEDGVLRGRASDREVTRPASGDIPDDIKRELIERRAEVRRPLCRVFRFCPNSWPKPLV